MKHYGMLAVDMGASNGRVVWGQWSEAGLSCQEIRRFDNVPVTVDGLMCFDVPSLMEEIVQGIRECDRQGLSVNSLGLCSWGNTIGLIGADGQLVRPPIHYREPGTEAALAELAERLSPLSRYRYTLYLPMAIQPAVVLAYLRNACPEALAQTKQVMMISDVFNYLLCGRAASERTMAATSGMVDMRTQTWSRRYMAQAGVNEEWFPPIVDSGTVLGPVKESLCAGGSRPVVIAVSGHDTASASGLVEAQAQEDSLYLSCGTWSCMGCSAQHAVEDDAVYAMGATNDLGPMGDHQLRFNHTGLWILQECRRYWQAQGLNFSHADLADMAAACGAQDGLIDTEDELFFHGGDMPQKVAAYLSRTGQPVPQRPAQIARIVLESLALRYRYSAQTLSALCGARFRALHVFGGGSQNRLLCQLTANATQLRVYAGPTEASTIGNFVQQGLALGCVSSRSDALARLRANSAPRVYHPDGEMEAKYQRVLQLGKWKTL